MSIVGISKLAPPMFQSWLRPWPAQALALALESAAGRARRRAVWSSGGAARVASTIADDIRAAGQPCCGWKAAVQCN